MDRVSGMYREFDAVYETRHERGEESIVMATSRALAEAEGVDPEALPPLHESIDADALSRLFDRGDGVDRPTETLLSFRVGNWQVFIRGDGRLLVCDTTRPVDPTPVFDAEIKADAGVEADR